MRKMIFAVTALAVVCSANAVSYFDGEFNAADYGHFAYFNDAATSTFRSPVGGNPGATLHHNIEHLGTTNSGNGKLGSYNFAFLYNPSVSGAIGSIDFSADYMLDTTAVIGGQAIFFSLIQDGTTYAMPVYDDFNPGQWVNASVTAGPTGWHKLDWINGAYSAANPDFSASGHEMMFGFVSGYGVSELASLTQRVDNFSVQTHPVPEPATMVVFALGAGIFGLRRRKRSQ